MIIMITLGDGDEDDKDANYHNCTDDDYFSIVMMQNTL